MALSTELTRRSALKMGTALVAASAVGAALPIQAASPAAPTLARTVGEPPLPHISVIALNRLAFGPRPGDAKTSLDAFMGFGADDEARLQNWLNDQLNPAGIVDTECDGLLAAANLTTLNKSLTQLWTDHYKNINGDYEIRIRPFEEARLATFIRATSSRRQLFEVLSDFWFNHFNVAGLDYGGISATFTHYLNQVIRPHVLGNFRQMLEAVAKAPAMLFYLDNNSSQGSNFNENYARELCELHGLGAENYYGVRDPFNNPLPKIPFTLPNTSLPVYDGSHWDGFTKPTQISEGYIDNDVYEIARCLTGWRVNDDRTWYEGITNTGTFQYYDGWHDRAQKLVMGVGFPPNSGSNTVDGLKALDLVAFHPRTAIFICRKLVRRLVSDDPPQSLVDSAAQVFRDNNTEPDQLKKVVEHIVLSTEFKTTWGQKAKRPFEVITSALRACNKPFTLNFGVENQMGSFFWTYQALGQPIFERRPPDGFPDKRESWIGTNTQVRTWSLVNYLLEGFDWAFPNLKPNLVSQNLGNTPAAITDFWLARILGRQNPNNTSEHIGRPMHPPANRDILMGMMQGWTADPEWMGETPLYGPNDAMSSEAIANRLPRMVALLLMTPDFLYK
jgi:uncharacterized protein (DUF1800 family)